MSRWDLKVKRLLATWMAVLFILAYPSIDECYIHMRGSGSIPTYLLVLKLTAKSHQMIYQSPLPVPVHVFIRFISPLLRRLPSALSSKTHGNTLPDSLPSRLALSLAAVINLLFAWICAICHCLICSRSYCKKLSLIRSKETISKARASGPNLLIGQKRMGRVRPRMRSSRMV